MPTSKAETEALVLPLVMAAQQLSRRPITRQMAEAGRHPDHRGRKECGCSIDPRCRRDPRHRSSTPIATSASRIHPTIGMLANIRISAEADVADPAAGSTFLPTD